MPSKTVVTTDQIEMIQGRDDTHKGFVAGIEGEPFYRVHITPQGEIKTGAGMAAPVKPAPKEHKDSHAVGGNDALSPADIGAATSGHAHPEAALYSPGGINAFHRGSISSVAAFAFGADDFRLWKLNLPPGNIRRVVVDVATAGDAASRLRPVFYRPNGVASAPASLFLDGGGNLDTSSAGIIVYTLPTQPAWGGGPLWVGAHLDAGTAPALRYVVSSAAEQVVASGSISSTNVAGTAYRATTGQFPQGPAPATFPAGAAGLNPPIVGVECY